MSVEGDTADKLVHEGLQVTETAIKLAGLGAKHLAALLLALLRDNIKLKGKTSMNRLLRSDKPLATFIVPRARLSEFMQKAKSHGILFTSVHHAGSEKGLCDVIARMEDTSRVNQIMEAMGLNAPQKENGAKNGKARVPQGDKLNERGFGWLQQAVERVIDPVKKIEGKAGMLESLPAEFLAAMVLKIAGENREFKEALPLAQLFDGGKDLQVVPIDGVMAVNIQEQAKVLNIPVYIQPVAEGGSHTLVAKTEDAPVLNRICENMGMAPPMRTEAPEKVAPSTAPTEKRGPGRPPKAEAEKAVRASVKEKVSEAKAQGTGAKNAPAKTKAPKPKAPAR